MTYPYTKLLRNITDIRPIPAMNGLIIESKDMRGKPESINVLDFNGTDLYNLIQEVYDMGKRDAREKIKDAIEGRY
jgi:hypothetical protein